MSIRKIISESGSILFWESCWINFALDRAVRRIKAISARNQWGVISHNFSNYCDCISITRIFPAPPGGIATSWARSKSRAKGTTLAPPQSHLYKPLRIRKEHQISRFTQSKNFLIFNQQELKRNMSTIPTTIRSIDLAFGIDRILGLSSQYSLPLPSTGNQESTKKSSRSRKRTVFSKFQLEQLEVAFEKCQYLVGQERHNLASQLGLEINTVKVWFQNRRIRLRKASPNTKANSVGSVSDSE